MAFGSPSVPNAEMISQLHREFLWLDVGQEKFADRVLFFVIACQVSERLET